jgi:SSS family solute:Na+ symporter
MTNAAAVLLSIGAAYVALSYRSLMEYIQLILATFNAPLFALVGLAALAPRRVARGGLAGFTLGLLSAALHQALVYARLLHYGSQMSANFYAAILGFTFTALSTLAIGSMRRQVTPQSSLGEETVRGGVYFSMPTVLLAVGILCVCVMLNVLFW